LAGVAGLSYSLGRQRSIVAVEIEVRTASGVAKNYNGATFSSDIT
jgi:hypothetical protein